MNPAVIDPALMEPMLLSLKVACVATLAALPLALALAWVLARLHFPGRSLLDGLVHLPLVLPPVVVGYVLLLAFGRQGWIGEPLERLFGLSFAFRWTGAALACAVMGLPLMVRAIRLSIEAVDPRLEHAARTLGASPLRVFTGVTLPLALPGLLAGSLLGFAKALGEFGATITFVASIPGETQTLSSALYQATQMPDGDGLALRLSLICAGLSMLALLVSEALARRMRRSAQGA
ncbi:MAG: molybdate ABC transporter permease subunit [Burkholderiaceae bacterium]